MALKFLGEVTGITMLAKYFGDQDKPEGIPLQEPKDFDGCSPAIPHENHFELLAPHNCNMALQRGFYFSFRLPDWARDFKEHTREIIASPFHASNSPPNSDASQHPKQKSKCFHGELRPERYGMIAEQMGANFFDEIPQDMRSKSGRPVRSPKIKDDVTCKKRV